MPVEIAPGDGEYLKRVGSAPVGADAEQLADDIDTALAANVVDTETAVGAALSAQFAPLDSPTFTGNVKIPNAAAADEAASLGQVDDWLYTRAPRSALWLP